MASNMVVATAFSLSGNIYQPPGNRFARGYSDAMLIKPARDQNQEEEEEKEKKEEDEEDEDEEDEDEKEGDKDDEVKTANETTVENRTLAFLVVTDDQKSEEVFLMKISMEDIKKQSLQTLQGHIKNSSHKEYCKLPFCTPQGGSIADLDRWTIEAYLEHVNDHKPNEQPSSNVYLRRKQLKVQAEDIPNINLSLPALPENLQAPKAPTILSSINKADWKAVTSINTKPQDLDQDSWKTVTFNNSLCYGLCVLHQDNGHGKSTPIGLIRAPYPAFRIKQRKVYDEEDEKEPELRVPDYIVDDQSYISIYETKTQFQSSLSKSGIDELDISISGGLPAFGGALGFSGGVKRSASDQTTTDESGESSQMNISYNFPRVTVRLDEYSLEITKKCKSELSKIKEKTAADDFLKMFGEYFSTQVQLGGRLFASEEFDSHSVSSAKDTKESMKVQAAASFKTPLGAGGSSSFGYGRARNEAESSSNSNLTSTLQWQANGGNTLLCNNPPEWCQTVAAYQNWRIIKRSGNRHILNLLAQFQEADIHNQVKFLMTEEVQDPKLPVQPQAMQQARQGRMFYLRTTTMGGGSKWYKYLTAFQTAVWTNNEISALRKVKADLPERCATALLHDSVDEGRKCGIFLECRTPEQHGVTKIMYNQPYILRNPSTGLYLYLDCKGNGDMFPVAMPKLPSEPTGYWYIRGVDGTEIGEAKQDTPVTIRYGKNETDASCSFLTVFHETKWSGLLKKGENADDDEVAFTMMYKDIYEGTAKA